LTKFSLLRQPQLELNWIHCVFDVLLEVWTAVVLTIPLNQQSMLFDCVEKFHLSKSAPPKLS